MKTSTSLADKLFPIDLNEEEVSVIDIPPEKRRLHTETYDFSISTIIAHLKEQSITVPPFQRNYVWTRAQASRLIESLIIQCPIPVIYLNQEKDETLSVIDGNQRLTSIKLYLEDEFELQGLTTYPELDGHFFSQLDPRFRRHILNRTLRCITILKETHPQIKFDVFERINTGAVQLNPQEVRHGVYHGSLMKLVDELSDEKIWKDLSGHRNDTRMKGSELILRFIALITMQEQYKKPLKGFLNEFCSSFHNVDEDRILQWKNDFLRTIEAVNYLFGKKAFKILDDNLEPVVRNINSALFDAVMVAFYKNNVSKRTLQAIDKDQLLTRIKDFMNENEFKQAITSGTSATAAVNFRINTLSEFMAAELR
ncbi:DUF262 domain-containing protein [Aeromonas veronii]